MALSQQFRQIMSNINQQAQRQQSSAQSANAFQTQQAITQAQAQPGGVVDATQLAQQFAPAITQAQSQAALQAQAQAGQQQLQATQAAAGMQAQQEDLRLREQQLASQQDIAKRQREGQLRQNSAELRQQKDLTQDEIDTQSRMRAAGFEFDNSLSFLTRKQREDLASLSGYAKQQMFDSRLQFKISEGKRQFTNTRQLADFAVASAKDEIDLKNKMREMRQASEKELIMLDAANRMISQRLEFEFAKAEQEQDQALKKRLYNYKKKLEDEFRRKKAQSVMTRQVIGGFMFIGGAALTITGAGAPAGMAMMAGGSAMASSGNEK